MAHQRHRFEDAGRTLDDAAMERFLLAEHVPALAGFPPCLTDEDAAAAIGELRRRDEPMLTDEGEAALLKRLQAFSNRATLAAVA